MSNLLKILRWERPDRPQLVFPRVVDAVVAKWIPVFDAEGNTYRSADRARLDVRNYEWSPAFSWPNTVVAPIVTKWNPVFSSELKGEMARSRAPLDVRKYDWSPEFTAPWRPVDAVVAKWIPAFGADKPIVGARATLDVRRQEWPAQQAWLFAAQPAAAITTDQQLPAWVQGQNSYRVPSLTGLLDDRHRTLGSSSFTLPFDATVAQQAAVFAAQVASGLRTAPAPTLDVRQAPSWSPETGWIFKAADAVTATWAPIFAAELGYRSPDRAVLDVRKAPSWAPGSGWLLNAVNAATATWAPVFSAELGYRSAGRVVLDVRSEWSPQTGWIYSIADTTIPSYAPIWNSELGYRSDARARFDVRPDQAPLPAWITNAATPPATTAQLWPAILSTLHQPRTFARPALDVRGCEWSPQGGWLPRVSASTVASWAAIFAAELATFRVRERASLDVRGQEWPAQQAWPFQVVPVTTTAQLWPAFQSALATYRSPEGPRFDVRAHAWASPLPWEVLAVTLPPTLYRVPVEEYFGWQRPVFSVQATPPGGPTKGDRYLVAVGAGGSWTGHDNDLAWWNGTNWLFDTPGPGWGVFNIADSTLYFLIGGVWTPY